MKYGAVEIKQKSRFEKGRFKCQEWELTYYDDDTDRIRGPTCPMGIGFYHYPKYIGLQRAFDKLKNKLIKDHKTGITRLEKSLKNLEKLQLPK